MASMILVMPMRNDSKFILATRLKELAEAQKISFKNLSEKSGVPIKTLYGWTAGNQPRKMQDLKAIACCLNVSVDDLVFAATPTHPTIASHWIGICRETSGLSQSEAATKAGLSIQDLVRYETQTDVPILVFLKLMKIYGQGQESVTAKIAEFYPV